jgi:hypothetical protein
VSQPRQLTKRDPELGPMRFCRRCNEWWPDDREFWMVVGRAGLTYTAKGRPYVRHHDTKACRACHDRPMRPKALANRRRRKEERAVTMAAKRPGWCACCLAVKTTQRLCHGCAGRYGGPLTGAFLVANGLAGVGQ